MIALAASLAHDIDDDDLDDDVAENGELAHDAILCWQGSQEDWRKASAMPSRLGTRTMPRDGAAGLLRAESRWKATMP